MIVSDARAFQSTFKMQIFPFRRQISNYGLHIYFKVQNAGHRSQVTGHRKFNEKSSTLR